MDLIDHLAAAATDRGLASRLLSQGASPRKLRCGIDDVTPGEVATLPRPILRRVAALSTDADVLSAVTHHRDVEAARLAAANPACPLPARRHVVDEWLADTHGREDLDAHVEILTAIAREDPDGFIAWAELLHAGVDGAVLAAVLRRLAEVDLGALVGCAARLLSGPPRWGQRVQRRVHDELRRAPIGAAQALVAAGVADAGVHRAACSVDPADELPDDPEALFARVLDLADRGLLDEEQLPRGRFPFTAGQARQVLRRDRPAELVWLLRSLGVVYHHDPVEASTPELAVVLEVAAACADASLDADLVDRLTMAALERMSRMPSQVDDVCGLDHSQRTAVAALVEAELAEGGDRAARRRQNAQVVAVRCAAAFAGHPALVRRMLAGLHTQLTAPQTPDQAVVEDLVVPLLGRLRDVGDGHPAGAYLAELFATDHATLERALAAFHTSPPELRRLAALTAPAVANRWDDGCRAALARLLTADVAAGVLRADQVPTVLALLADDWQGTYADLVAAVGALHAPIDAPSTTT